MTSNNSVPSRTASRQFSDVALGRGPVWMRDRALESPLTIILGVDVQDSPHAISLGYTSRATQLNERFADAREPEARAAVVDLLAILVRAYEVLSDPAERERYLAADLPKFAAYVQDFALTSHSTGIDLERRRLARARNRSHKRTPPARRSTPAPEGPVTGPLRPAPVPARVTARRTSGRRQHVPATSSAPLRRAPRTTVLHGQESRAERSGRAPRSTPPTTPAVKAAPAAPATKGKRPAWARLAGPSGQPSALKGPLTFGVGVARRGLLHVGGVYALAFVASLILLAAGLGARELSLDPGEGMIIYRSVLLFGLAVGAVCLLRRESPLRFGLMPRWGVVIALPVAVGLGWFASVLARFEIEPGNTNLWGTVAVLVAVRAIGEATFFQGFVTRTLLVELRNPGLAVLGSAVLYGLYGSTYAAIAGASAFQTGFACAIYAIGGGLPMGLMYAKTRSLPALIVCNWIILMGSAWGGVAYALKTAG